MIGILALGACTGAPSTPDDAFSPPADARNEHVITLGRTEVQTWETGADHQPPLPPHRDWVRTRFEGRVVRLGEREIANRISLPPVDDPAVGAFRLDDTGWLLVDFVTGKQTLMWSDWAIDGVWTSDGAWFVSDMGAWDVATQTRHPLSIPNDASFVAFSPDQTATVEFARSSAWEGTQVLTQRVFRVRDGSGVVIQELDVSDGAHAWVDDAGAAGFRWPLTPDTTALWQARHLDWSRPSGRWQVTLAEETRPWPKPAGD